MSGICGAVRLDGSPDASRIERMTSWLTRVGPDGRSTWRGKHAGFGHTLLDTTDGRIPDPQPATLDGRQWIVADARIDARAELVSALAAAGERARADATDAQLILHAWRAWGEACPERLLGDFAFAIWDEAAKTLFCARDHLGVKPFFHGVSGGEFVFASSIGALRCEGGLDDGLDETWIADFLLFEISRDPGATAFASIRRLAPAHCLALSPSGIRIRRYWQLPPAPMPEHRGDAECLEQLDELLDRAVADRVRGATASVFMSGGLDSPAIASAAARRGIRVEAFSSVYDRIVPDDERRFSALAARSIGIPIRHRACDDYGLFERYRELAFHFPEPATAPFAAADVDLLDDAAAHSRVVLTGWDGDGLLSESPRPYLRALAAHGRWLRLAAAIGRLGREHPARAWRSVWLRLRGGVQAPTRPAYFPPWLNDDFASRLHLRERWDDAMREPRRQDPLRPQASRLFDLLARLGNFFEGYDPARTRIAAEARHPMCDLRLVRFCLSLPAVPWCIDKQILRRWLRGRIAESVRLRPKTPLGGFPHLAAPGADGACAFVPCEDAAAFINGGKIASMRHDADPAISWVNLRPLALDLWCRHARSAWETR